MKLPYTTRMSSRGQVVIPETIRKTMGLEAGTPFLVIAREDTIVLQRLQETPWEFLDELTKTAQRRGKAHDAAMQGYARFMKKLKYGR
jgi:AbrB family looped-hinge helix DNA binding protein